MGWGQFLRIGAVVRNSWHGARIDSGYGDAGYVIERYRFFRNYCTADFLVVNECPKLIIAKFGRMLKLLARSVWTNGL